MSSLTKYSEIISLGYDCTIARQAREAEMRTKSYPFDWLVSMNTEKVFNCIENSFSGFTEIVKTTRIGEKDYYTNSYDMVFLHHSHFSLSELKEKFDKKIENFNDTLINSENVLLLRKLHGSHEKMFCRSSNNNPENDFLLFDKFKQFLVKKYNKNIDVKMLMSCAECSKKYNYPYLYNPNGDDNMTYFEYFKSIKK